jgi:hypothetical protein
MGPALALFTGACLWIAGIGFSTAFAAVTPDYVKEWANALGVSPVVIVLGIALWMLTWRAHNQNLAAIKDNSDAIRALTHAVLADDDDELPPPRRLR